MKKLIENLGKHVGAFESGIEEGLSSGDLRRMEGIVSTAHVSKFESAAKGIVKDLKDEDFEVSDIRAFLAHLFAGIKYR